MLYVFTGTAVLSTFLSEDLITAEEAEEFTKVFTESNVRDSEYFVWKLVMRVCLHQSLDMCQKATALLEGSRLNTSASIRLLKGIWLPCKTIQVDVYTSILIIFIKNSKGFRKG